MPTRPERTPVDLFGRPVVRPAAQLPLSLTIRVDPRVSRPPVRLELSIGRKGKGMAQFGNDFDLAVGARWGAALRARYPSVKDVARAFEVSLHTASAWWAGQAPYARVLVRAWRLHGAGLIAEVIAGSGEWALTAGLDEALTRIERELSTMRGDVTARLRIKSDA